MIENTEGKLTDKSEKLIRESKWAKITTVEEVYCRLRSDKFNRIL